MDSQGHIRLEAGIKKVKTLERKMDSLGKTIVPLLDVIDQISLICAIEGRITRQHLKEYHSERPDIRFMIVLLPVQNLRSHDEGSTALCLSQIIISVELLCEAQICNLDLEISCQEIYLAEVVILSYSS